VRSLPPEERCGAAADDPRRERVRSDDQPGAPGGGDLKRVGEVGGRPPELIGESEIRPTRRTSCSTCWAERWRKVELFGGLDGTPFSLDTHRPSS
jgi:hypothetical protein